MAELLDHHVQGRAIHPALDARPRATAKRLVQQTYNGAAIWVPGKLVRLYNLHQA
jgi:hypothetical protein